MEYDRNMQGAAHLLITDAPVISVPRHKAAKLSYCVSAGGRTPLLSAVRQSICLLPASPSRSLCPCLCMLSLSLSLSPSQSHFSLSSSIYPFHSLSCPLSFFLTLLSSLLPLCYLCFSFALNSIPWVSIYFIARPHTQYILLKHLKHE